LTGRSYPVCAQDKTYDFNLERRVRSCSVITRACRRRRRWSSRSSWLSFRSCVGSSGSGTS